MPAGKGLEEWIPFLQLVLKINEASILLLRIEASWLAIIYNGIVKGL